MFKQYFHHITSVLKAIFHVFYTRMGILDNIWKNGIFGCNLENVYQTIIIKPSNSTIHAAEAKASSNVFLSAFFSPDTHCMFHSLVDETGWSGFHFCSWILRHKWSKWWLSFDLVYRLSRKIFWFAGDAINIWSSLQRDRSPPISSPPSGFATGVENMGGSSKFDGRGGT